MTRNTLFLMAIAFCVGFLIMPAMNYVTGGKGILQTRPYISGPNQEPSPTPPTQPPGQPPIVQPPVKPQPPTVLPEPKTFAEAVAQSRQSKKPLFMIFSALWCGPCNEMKQGTWPDPQVQAALKNYVLYHVNVDKERQLANQCGIRSIPTYGTYDVSGDTIKAVKVTSGARSPQEFISWLGQN